ncbi:MAG: TonB-dependent receptor plug domain-containing protein [Saprospiraceae bacterium]
MKRHLLLLPALLFLTSLAAQSPFETVMLDYRQQLLPEKVFVHTDKNIYATGEIIWAAVYLVNGQTHRPGTFSNQIRLELINPAGEVVTRRKLYSTDGFVASDLIIPATSPPGDYQLTAYTSYQLNGPVETLFRKTLRIVPGLKESGAPGSAPSLAAATFAAPLTGPDTKLRFFPEGGDCVTGVPCRMAIVTEDRGGIPTAANGYLTDDSGEALMIWQTDKYGSGSFTYTPEPGRDYQAVLNQTGGVFSLPQPLNEGYHLAVFQNRENIQLQLFSTQRWGLDDARITVHLRGIALLDQLLAVKDNAGQITLARADLPPGVLVATLFDDRGQPAAERLFFVAPEKENSTIQINLDTTHYKTRQAVDVRLRIDPTDAPVDTLSEARISMSVLPAAATGGPAGDDIRTWLMLNSDIDHSIPYAPEIVFGLEDRVRDVTIDQFLLTRAWRRFRWQPLLQDSAFVPQHLIELGVYVRGTAYNYENPDKPRPGKVFFTKMDDGRYEEQLTTLDGDFVFGPYVTFDTSDVFLQGRFKLGKRNRQNEDIDIDDNPYVLLRVREPAHPTLPEIPYFDRLRESAGEADDYGDLSKRALTVARTYDSLIINLDVVDVVTKRVDKAEERRNARSTLYSSPDSRIVVDSLPGGQNAISVFDLLRRVPGVRVIGSFGQEFAEIRGITSILLSSEPLYFIDGVPVDVQFVRNVPVQQIEFIDVIRGARAAIFGGGGANGAILLYSRQGDSGGGSVIPGKLKTKLYGFHKAREFAVFDPQLPDNRNRPDLRTTLFWAPGLRTDAAGRAGQTFSSSDQTGDYLIVAQGLRKDGRPYVGIAQFTVEE